MLDFLKKNIFSFLKRGFMLLFNYETITKNLFKNTSEQEFIFTKH